jgi:hypothetical protein
MQFWALTEIFEGVDFVRRYIVTIISIVVCFLEIAVRPSAVARRPSIINIKTIHSYYVNL